MLLALELIQNHQPPHIYLGYSGGVDSHVLLHLCASVPEIKAKLTAVYIHHGLQAEADAWLHHCQQSAEALGVAFKALHVNAKAQTGESPEEAARNARYTALQSLMQAGDAVLVAQHQEDQLETVLLQLFRGSGLNGLSGMPASMVFGPGILLRPLLTVSKQAINDYAQSYALKWVEDPSNQSEDYDRNFLRNSIVPLLKQRWPALDKTVARTAGHCADAASLQAEIAETLLATVLNPDDNTLSLDRLQAHPPQKQSLIIRQWFKRQGLKMPSQMQLSRLQNDVIAARSDSNPILNGPTYSLRRYRNKLCCLPMELPETPKDCLWPKGQNSVQFSPKLSISWQLSSKGILRERFENALVEIRFRSGGERIALAGRAGRHSLKKLYQEAGIPPWERERMPLVYLDGELAAVGGYWVGAEFCGEKLEGCVSFYLLSGEQL